MEAIRKYRIFNGKTLETFYMKKEPIGDIIRFKPQVDSFSSIMSYPSDKILTQTDILNHIARIALEYSINEEDYYDCFVDIFEDDYIACNYHATNERISIAIEVLVNMMETFQSLINYSIEDNTIAHIYASYRAHVSNICMKWKSSNRKLNYERVECGYALRDIMLYYLTIQEIAYDLIINKTLTLPIEKYINIGILVAKIKWYIAELGRDLAIVPVIDDILIQIKERYSQGVKSATLIDNIERSFVDDKPKTQPYKIITKTIEKLYKKDDIYSAVVIISSRMEENWNGFIRRLYQ